MEPAPPWQPPPGWPPAVRLGPPPAPPAAPPRWGLGLALMLATFLTTTTLGAHFLIVTRTDMTTDVAFWPVVGPVLSPSAILDVWARPDRLRLGLAVALPTMLILLSHELGHYLLCRRYRIRATVPYFLPAPFGLGTLGAFIRIRSVIRNKRELFDVGIGGPIAGFVALLPFLIYGIAHSRPARIEVATSIEDAGALLFRLGDSLAMRAVSRYFHGDLPSDVVLDWHPFVLAAWVGLLATAINLLPLGQLDGGHLLYAVLGRRQRLLVWPLWLALVGAGFLNPSWWLWALIVAILGLRHPPLLDEAMPLGSGRAVLALVALAILVVSFMPVPASGLIMAR
jgi:membrane-associated protease RseP (regulator of RpoE activity)